MGSSHAAQAGPNCWAQELRQPPPPKAKGPQAGATAPRPEFPTVSVTHIHVKTSFYTRTKRQTKSLLHHCLSRVAARDIFSKRLPGPARRWPAPEDPGQRTFPPPPEVAVTPGSAPDRGGSGVALRGLPLPQAPHPSSAPWLLAAYSYGPGPGRGAARPELPVERLPEG
ncbi:uncharacterized protein [Symphalangus syndactylus]|uniref:uncharacterized protein isoform X2 n=1 Tax=Symphalangus syndactylus TaxID=9590 RepID=UPI003006C303